jgi:uncharacterized protein YlbG (UPF0298 family)|tara:strand:+ start:1533 stop:1760 length:228 start_codon:yes stop_codon:yes gene_type:complete
MEINEKHLERLVNDQRRIDANLEMHKNKFIKEMRGGLGEKIKEEINKPKKEIKEEDQTKGLFRTLKKWISKISKK